MLWGDQTDPKSSATGKQLITLLDHFIVYIGEQASILPKQGAGKRLTELASHDWRTPRCFLLAYLRPHGITARSETRVCETQVSTASGPISTAITPYECSDESLTHYMELFESLIDYPEAEEVSHENRFQDLPQCGGDANGLPTTPEPPPLDDPSELSRSNPLVMNNSPTNNEEITSLPSAALAFSKDDLKYVEILSSWKPIIDYHPLRTPKNALDRNHSSAEGSASIFDRPANQMLKAPIPAHVSLYELDNQERLAPLIPVHHPRNLGSSLTIKESDVLSSYPEGNAKRDRFRPWTNMLWPLTQGKKKNCIPIAILDQSSDEATDRSRSTNYYEQPPPENESIGGVSNSWASESKPQSINRYWPCGSSLQPFSAKEIHEVMRSFKRPLPPPSTFENSHQFWDELC